MPHSSFACLALHSVLYVRLPLWSVMKRIPFGNVAPVSCRQNLVKSSSLSSNQHST